jgi:hypothetical protein
MAAVDEQTGAALASLFELKIPGQYAAGVAPRKISLMVL